MWVSMLQNGRKKEKQKGSNRNGQYSRLVEKSVSLSCMSKSSVIGETRKEERVVNAKEKQNVNGNNVRFLSKTKQTSSVNILGNRQNMFLGMSNNVQENEINKKSLIRVVQEQQFSILKTKKNEIMMIDKQKQGDQKKGLYYLRLLRKKNKFRSELNISIHNSIFTFKQFMRACQVAQPKSIQCRVPPQIQNRKTIVFDMDETLIHTNQTVTPNFQIKVPFRSFQGRIGFGFVEVRPHCKEILKRLSQHFDIIIFTASTQAYADPILDHIDPDRVVKCRLYRESCSLIKNQIFVKDLRVLGRKLSNLLLVDNAPYSYLMQLQNAIPIIPYYRGKNDDELLSLQDYLMKMKDLEDVRTVNKQHFKLHEYMKFDSHQKLISKLYGEYLK